MTAVCNVFLPLETYWNSNEEAILDFEIQINDISV
jgi:hypothetical protein